MCFSSSLLKIGRRDSYWSVVARAVVAVGFQNRYIQHRKISRTLGKHRLQSIHCNGISNGESSHF